MKFGTLFFSLSLLIGIMLPNNGVPTPASCGPIHNPDGTYTFSRLFVDPTGHIIDPNGCHVDLLGVNSGGAMEGAGGDVGSGGDEVLPINTVVRLAFNERWYVSNVYVPNQGMNYQPWIAEMVSTYESRGDYVLLDADTAFFEPPCGGSIQFCPSEDQGRLDYANPSSPYYQNPYQLEESQGIALQALTLMAQTFSNDPAVMFDVWNEPASYIFVIPNTEQYRTTWMNERINTVRQYDPLTPVFVFSIGDTENLGYTQGNLVFDFHVYPNFSGVSPITGTSCSTTEPDWTNLAEHMSTLESAGRAVFIGEWGHCYDVPTYNTQILSVAEEYYTGMAYFAQPDLFTSKLLNQNGQFEQSDYSTLQAQY
ncbi:MAG: cellulase family glycosylhydrolase [Ktedonobacteraceae bacterium]